MNATTIDVHQRILLKYQPTINAGIPNITTCIEEITSMMTMIAIKGVQFPFCWIFPPVSNARKMITKPIVKAIIDGAMAAPNKAKIALAINFEGKVQSSYSRSC